MKYVSIPVALFLFIMLFAYCGSKSTSPDTNTPVSGSKITLDAAGALLSPVTIQAPSGATLTIDSGTTVLMLDSGVFQPVPAGDTVLVALDDGDSSGRVEITGMSVAALFRISATVNGNTAELRFLSHTAPITATMPVSGAHWAAILSDTAIHAGSRISLYKINGSAYTLIGSQYTGIPTRVLAKTGAGDQPTSVAPNGTGDFQVDAGDGGSSSSSSATIPSGTYWNTYSNIPDTSYDVNGVTVGGPLTVGFLEIGELSTAELIAGFWFDPGVTCVSWTNPNDGAQYWAELTQSAGGKTTSVKIAATVANIFYMNLKLVSVSSRMPVLFVNCLQPDGNGVHAPDNSVLSDPYQNSSLKFGGAKELNFSTKNINDGIKIKGKVQEAGYEISHSMFADKIYQFDFCLTLDGRKLVEEKILQPNGWFPVQGSATWRNRGLYIHNDSLFINISSHGAGDKVNAMRQTVTGTFTNAAGEPDTVKRMTVKWTALGNMDSAEASLGNGGTSFSVDCDLYTGDNLFIFQPYVMDNYGAETYQLRTIIKAKATRTKLFVINFKEQRNGVLIIHEKTTTHTKDPDTALAIDDVTVTANLTMTPNQVVLNSIQTSAGSAATCASSQSCSILDGVSDSTQEVTVSEQYQMSSRNCDHDLPLINMESWNGSMSFSNYGLARVFCTLLPPGTGANRQYSLTVDIRPTLQMMSTPNHAGKGQYFDCLVDSTWKPETMDIFPHITLTKSDSPPVLQFGSAATLEGYVAAPDSGGSWMFRGTKYSADSMSITEYDATLTVSP